MTLNKKEFIMLKSLSLKTKLLLLCLTIAMGSLIVGGVNYYGLEEVTEEYDFLTTKSYPKISLVDKMFLDFRRVRITLRTLGLVGLSKVDADAAIKDAVESIAHYNESKQEYEAMGFIPGQKEIYSKLDLQWGAFQEVGARVIALYKTGKSEDKQAMMQIFITECPDISKAYTVLIKEMQSFHEKIVSEKIQEANKHATSSKLASLTCLIIILSFSLITAFLFSNNISKKLSEISASLSQGANSVSVAATQIASASEELSQSAVEQASSLQETTTSIEETSAMVSKNADNAKKSTEVSMKGQDSALRGKKAVEEMVLSIDEISKNNADIMIQVNEGNREISEIVKVIAEIGNKTKIINDIVFQTKLLSFNASVEAARAGDQGKGFAVVAEEVGNLAEMSGNAAKEITEMLDGSIVKVEDIVKRTKIRVENLILLGKEKVQTGTVMAERCNDVLNEIVLNVSNVNSYVSEISIASQEQAQGIREINRAITQLDQVGHQNTSASEQASATAQDLNQQVHSLRSMVDSLNETLLGIKT